eukprot:7053118-Prymnesium_polylepis.1
MREFRSGKAHALVATTEVARRIDVSRVSKVFNYDLPRLEQYWWVAGIRTSVIFNIIVGLAPQVCLEPPPLTPSHCLLCAFPPSSYRRVALARTHVSRY